MKPTETDVLIIGAGPSGSAAASMLHRDGFNVLIAEKQIFPRFVIGESLLPHCMDLLQEAGLLDAAEAQGFIHKCGAVFLQGNQTCNFDFSNQFTLGWKYTYQVPRADFDKALADAVAARGVPILYGRSEEHTSELQSQSNLVCRLLLEKKKKYRPNQHITTTHKTP